MSLLEKKLTVKEAAEYVGCSVSFIRVRVNDGRIPTVKLGNRAYIDPSDLEALVSNGTSELV
ncbi:MAG: helix-turn-helix domain-containing protein [Thaumarchaeota archaeon]|nr:helix-turn-helix domain-containing protein [Nitrososphaerota archaeon]